MGLVQAPPLGAVITNGVIMLGRPPSDVPKEYNSWQRLPGLLLGAFRVVREAAPREFAISTVLQLVQGAATGVELLVVRNILAAVLAGASHHDYLPAVEQLVVLVALQTVIGLVGTYTTMQQQLVTELVQRHASRPVTEVATTIGLKDFDTPEFHDRMQRAQQTATMRPLQVTNAVLTIGRSLLGLVGIVIAMLILSPLLLAVALLGFLPLWLATTRISRAVCEFMIEMTPRGACLRPWQHLRNVYERLSDEQIARLRGHLRHRAGLSFLGSAGNAVAGGVTFGVLAWLITSGHIGLATAGAAAMATFQLGAQLQGIVFAGGQLYESALFIEDLDAFLGLLPALKAARPDATAP